jgi:transcriptional regulator with XRE-family HTH domain
MDNKPTQKGVAMKSTFGTFLKIKRQEKGLTQKDLAAHLFVSPSAVSKWEKDVAHPDISLLPKLAEILEVTEHELITASVDEAAREERKQAKKWRTLAFSWQLFFYIAYGVALIPCFICNLAIQHTLSWFWIVFFSLLLAFTFTNLPALMKQSRLLVLPLASFLSLVALLGVIALYTRGNWFFLVTLSTFVALSFIFIPIYINKYKVFERVRAYADFLSLTLDFVLVNLLLLSIDNYTVKHGFSPSHWFIPIALPITIFVFLTICLLVSTRFLPINRLFKTGLVLFVSAIILYGTPLLIKSDNPAMQDTLNGFNILLADLSNWHTDAPLGSNIHLIIFLSAMLVAFAFLLAGLLLHRRKSKARTA